MKVLKTNALSSVVIVFILLARVSSVNVAAADEHLHIPPAKPLDISGLPYSSSAVEIFWTHATAPLSRVHFKVFRNDELVGSTDGRSWFEQGLSANTSYLYTVVAVDELDNESVPSDSISLKTFDGTAPIVPAVTGLRAEVYAENFAELFWDRQPSATVDYGIYIKGSLVDTTNGTSWWSRNFDSGSNTVVSVAARGHTGAISAFSAVTVSTPDVPGSTRLPAARGLRSEVYSSTAAELFWERENLFGIRYLVLADGQEIATTNGISLFVDDLVPGSTTTFTVFAVDDLGNKSATRSTNVTTPTTEPDFNNDPLFNGIRLSTSAPWIIETLVAYELDDQLATDILTLTDRIAATALDSEVLDFDPVEMNPPFGTSGSETLYQCALGGTMNASLYRELENSGTGLRESMDNQYGFDFCGVTVASEALPPGEYILDGTFEQNTFDFSGRGANRQSELIWTGFTLYGPDNNETVVDGTTRDSFIDQIGAIFRSRQVQINNYERKNFFRNNQSMTDVLVDIADNSNSAIPVNLRFSVNGRVKGFGTGGSTVTVNTVQEFSHFSAFNGVFEPFTGQLQATSDTGDTLTLNAVAEGPAFDRTVRFDISNTDGEFSVLRPFTQYVPLPLGEDAINPIP